MHLSLATVNNHAPGHELSRSTVSEWVVGPAEHWQSLVLVLIHAATLLWPVELPRVAVWIMRYTSQLSLRPIADAILRLEQVILDGWASGADVPLLHSGLKERAVLAWDTDRGRLLLVRWLGELKVLDHLWPSWIQQLLLFLVYLQLLFKSWDVFWQIM